jgi:hypothetical protein
MYLRERPREMGFEWAVRIATKVRTRWDGSLLITNRNPDFPTPQAIHHLQRFPTLHDTRIPFPIEEGPAEDGCTHDILLLLGLPELRGGVETSGDGHGEIRAKESEEGRGSRGLSEVKRIGFEEEGGWVGWAGKEERE